MDTICKVLYSDGMEVTSEFGALAQMEQGLVELVNWIHHTHFGSLRDIVGFFFGDCDGDKVERLGPHEKKWMVLGMLLALPLRERFFQCSPLSRSEFKVFCTKVGCAGDESGEFSFVKFEVSSEKLCELVGGTLDHLMRCSNTLSSRMFQIQSLEERLREQNLIQSWSLPSSESSSRDLLQVSSIPLIESQIQLPHMDAPCLSSQSWIGKGLTVNLLVLGCVLWCGMWLA